MNLRRNLTAGIAVLSLALGIAAGANSTYNEETSGLWIAGYGLELDGPQGIELVHCYQVPDVPGFAEVDC